RAQLHRSCSLGRESHVPRQSSAPIPGTSADLGRPALARIAPIATGCIARIAEPQAKSRMLRCAASIPLAAPQSARPQLPVPAIPPRTAVAPASRFRRPHVGNPSRNLGYRRNWNAEAQLAFLQFDPFLWLG